MLPRPFVAYATHTLYVPGLVSRARVVDLGTNRGAFLDHLSTVVPDGEFHCVEANPAFIPVLRERYASAELCAVTASNQRVTLHVAANDEASSILPLSEHSGIGAVEVGSVAVEGRSMEAILSGFRGFIDVVKVDIEGAETDALLSLTPSTLERVGQFTVEFHTDPVFNFGLRKATKAAIKHVKRHGFLVLSFAVSDMDVLLINREYFGIGRIQSAIWTLSVGWRRWKEASAQRTRPLRHRIGFRRRAATARTPPTSSRPK